VNQVTQNIVAVKIIKNEKLKSNLRLSKFIQSEVTSLKKISHPNIIKFIEILRTSNNIYLVYEYCNGGNLAEYIKKNKKIEDKEAFLIFQQILNGITAL